MALQYEEEDYVAAIEKKDLSKLRQILHRVHSGYWKPFYKSKSMNAMIKEAEGLAAKLSAADEARKALREAIETGDEEALATAISAAERVDVSAKVAKKVSIDSDLLERCHIVPSIYE